MIAAALLACAINVSPVTLKAIVDVESGGNPLALNVNRLRGPQPQPASIAEALRDTETYMALGYSVDIGLMQVNSRNLGALGFTIQQVLDPCTNIEGGARILTANYAQAVLAFGEGQDALRAALSAYNTGGFYRGFTNGYVARYYGARSIPAFGGGVRQAKVTHVKIERTSQRPPSNPYTAGTQVFVREAAAFPVD
jgi:type IV secretion system protein VirB1